MLQLKKKKKKNHWEGSKKEAWCFLLQPATSQQEYIVKLFKHLSQDRQCFPVCWPDERSILGYDMSLQTCTWKKTTSRSLARGCRSTGLHLGTFHDCHWRRAVQVGSGSRACVRPRGGPLCLHCCISSWQLSQLWHSILFYLIISIIWKHLYVSGCRMSWYYCARGFVRVHYKTWLIVIHNALFE